MIKNWKISSEMVQEKHWEPWRTAHSYTLTVPKEVGGRKESLVKRAEGPKSICSFLVGSGERDSPPVYPKTSRGEWLESEVNPHKPYRLQPVGIMAQLFRSSEMPSMIHICLPNMTPYKSNIWHIQSTATISHNYASQAHRLTSLSYKNLTMSHSSLTHSFLSTNQTKRKDRRGQKQQRIRRYKQENNIRQSKTRKKNMTSCFCSLLLFMVHGRNQRAPFFTIPRVEGPLPAGAQWALEDWGQSPILYILHWFLN